MTASELADLTFLADYLQETYVTTVAVSRIVQFSDCGSLLEYLNRVQDFICLVRLCVSTLISDLYPNGFL